MLREGSDSRGRGEDVVVGFVETHGRARTIAAIGSLEVVPRLQIGNGGCPIEDMDVDAVLARGPAVALVDDLAHTNVAGARNLKRWQDIEELRDAGIDVVTTVDVQQIESAKDLVEHITQIPVRETVPDTVIDGASEIQLIDISPEALRKRLRHGNICAPDQVEPALADFFRPGNLAALREIALRVIAQRVAGTRGSSAAPQDVLVAVSPRETSDRLIRRGARLARRFHGRCTVVLARPRGRRPDPVVVDRLQSLATVLGCAVMVRDGGIRAVIGHAANELGVRHLVIGAEAAGPVSTRLRGGIVDAVMQRLSDVDVHVVAHAGVQVRSSARQPPQPGGGPAVRAPAAAPGRGNLRIYLGYARGCGTTTALLEEGLRRRQRGTDVVVAAVQTSNRTTCESPLRQLEVLGGPDSPARSGRLDTEMLLRRRPEVACIDDLAGSTTTGGWISDAVLPILEAGISVVATLHLASLRSVRAGTSAAIGPLVAAGALVDDALLSLADELELIDATPSILHQRLRRGDIAPQESAARPLQEEFGTPVLTELREAAFRVVAAHTDRRLVDYMRERHIDRPWEARPRVVLCVSARDGMVPVIRQTARRARAANADFSAVTVNTRARSDAETARLGRYATLTHQLGGDFTTLHARRVASALAEHARKTFATEVVLTRAHDKGSRQRTVRELVRILGDVDVHILGNRRRGVAATEARAT